MGDIADLLGIKTPFLSAVETGKISNGFKTFYPKRRNNK